MSWHTVTVSELVKESPDSISITVEQPTNFDWLPGQHIQVKTKLKERELKRIFSISSDVSQPLRITVKQSTKGIVSKYLNTKLKVGDKLEISNAAGRFCHKVNSVNRKSYYFFAAGSGITPIYAMMVHILAYEPQSYVYLLYGNKNAKHTIFKEQLQELEQKYENSLVIRHCHSSSSWLDYSPWHSGRLDATAIAKFIKENPPYAQNCQYFICGPDTFIPNIKRALNNIDVPDNCIHSESFGGNNVEQKSNSQTANLTVNLNNKKHLLKVQSEQTLLRAMQEQNFEVPYSCEAGVCGTCQCNLVSGEVSMLNNSVLSKEELQQGKVLACQSYAKTDKIEIDYS